jgi:hypothetical protein
MMVAGNLNVNPRSHMACRDLRTKKSRAQESPA